MLNFMWILFAFGSAFFAGITAILAKIGIKNTDLNFILKEKLSKKGIIGLVSIVTRTLLLLV